LTHAFIGKAQTISFKNIFNRFGCLFLFTAFVYGTLKIENQRVISGSLASK
jgi:hypothetical protein